MRAKLIFGTWLKQQLKEGSENWGEKTVLEKRTRRPSMVKPEESAIQPEESVIKPEDDVDEEESKRRKRPRQLLLFEL
jgi:hypothetical protein